MVLPEQFIGKLEQLGYLRDEIGKQSQQRLQQKLAELALTVAPVLLGDRLWGIHAEELSGRPSITVSF
ncbi:hypothetical protein SAMN05216191_12220 [Paenibacillus jilunlii]|uniref:Uncharacterized protein n=2 Tax=Paenibacillus jilunlii TaxID=682956 RepID=A0A1G9XHI4_9BACL|nr:hypothetical protein AML91_21970 [Paenibacillus jilunlii]SDM95991.1 hypothetical protein SAMN05216191_12220 [Paenibacillus jilunlii]